MFQIWKWTKKKKEEKEPDMQSMFYENSYFPKTILLETKRSKKDEYVMSNSVPSNTQCGQSIIDRFGVVCVYWDNLYNERSHIVIILLNALLLYKVKINELQLKATNYYN